MKDLVTAVGKTMQFQSRKQRGARPARLAGRAHTNGHNSLLLACIGNLRGRAAAIGGLEDIVRAGETGLLVPAGEAEPLAAAMLALAADPARAAAMGVEARRRALARFPESRCTERTEEVYRFWLDERANRQLPYRETNHSIAAAASSASTKSQATR